MAQTYHQGPLLPSLQPKALSKEDLEAMREELEALKAQYNLREPVRSFMDEEGIQWRFGGPPNYTLANLLFLKGKTKNHAEGSLEQIVENLVKTWEMERSHKLDPDSHRSVDPERFKISANGGKKFDNKEANKVGNYNVLLQGCSSALYDTSCSWEQSHETFHHAFAGFPWEVLEVFSPPPRVSFSWRHWGHFTGSYEGHQGSGELVEMYGFAVAEVDDSLRLVDVEVYYKADSFLEVMKGLKPASSLSGGKDLLGARAPAGCPYLQTLTKGEVGKGYEGSMCPHLEAMKAINSGAAGA